MKTKEAFIDNLRILGRDYKVDYVPPSDFPQDALGSCDNKTQTLRISADQTPIEATDTFIHEVFHAIDYLVGLEMSEHQVRHLASTFTGVLQDNPEWASWIIQNKTLERKAVSEHNKTRPAKKSSPSISFSPSRANPPKGRIRKG